MGITHNAANMKKKYETDKPVKFKLKIPVGVHI